METRRARPQRTPLLPLLLLLLAIGCGEDAAGPDSSPGSRYGSPIGELERPNVVLVSIDSLRRDHVSGYGYERDTTPRLDELARGGVRFDDALSTTSWTLPAHAALFTGLTDSVHGVVDNGQRLSDEHLTLAELLARRGYRTAGFFGGPYLHPTFGLAQGFEVYESCMQGVPAGSDEAVRTSARSADGPAHVDVTGPRTREAIRRWAASGADERPFFLFVHLWDVHYDYLAPPEYVARFTDPDYDGSVAGDAMTDPSVGALEGADREHLLALYDAEIRFTDDVLAGILEDLDARGMLANTLVLVTSDHGEEFFEHGGKGHNRTLYDEVVRIPLIASWPGVIPAGRVVTTQVQLIDLLPTLAVLAGVAGPVAVQGRDLSPLLLAGAELPARDALTELLLDGENQRALRGAGRKVYRPTRGDPVRFDLERDPGEHAPESIDPNGADADALRAAILRGMEFRRLLGGASEADVIELTPDMELRLRSLGYLGEEE